MEVPRYRHKLPHMSRKRRPNCPGVAFHVVTRITGSAHHLDEVSRPHILEAIAESTTRSDARVLAHAIMTTHLHLVIRQGSDPLFRLMQPALRRVALIVQRRHGVRGHVFESSFRESACLTARYLRHAIIYTHLNPVRAGMCSNPDEADFTSHRRYLDNGATADPLAIRILPAWELFSTGRHTHLAQWREDYCDYMAYRRACDAADAALQLRPINKPDTGGGDEFFDANFAKTLDSTVKPVRRMDLRDFVLHMLSVKGVDIPIRSMRGSQIGCRKLQKLREEIIRGAAAEGYPGVAIAAFFVMSPSRVSVLHRRKTDDMSGRVDPK